MQHEHFVPQHRGKLYSCQTTGRDDDGEVKNDAGAVEGLAEVEPFSRCSIPAKVSVHGQIWRSSEAEAEHGACEKEPEQRIVGFAEAKGSARLAKRTDDGVRGFDFVGLGRHCKIWFDGPL